MLSEYCFACSVLHLAVITSDILSTGGYRENQNPKSDFVNVTLSCV